MKTTITQIIQSTNTDAALLPVLLGQHPVEWAKSLVTESVVTKSGREISAARAALNGAQFTMTNLAMAMRAATELGVLPYTKAVQATKHFYNLLDGLRTAFAGVRNEAHRELTVAELTLEVKDGVFDDLQSQSGSYTREELEELAREGSLDWDAIDTILEYQDAANATRQAELGKDVDATSDNEGEYRTSIHEAKTLWDIELRDIRYAEIAAARVALIGVEWPTHNPMWEPLLDRLADTWAASIEYAEDKEEAARKVERREQALDDLWAKPQYARWAINHVARRVFRDIEALRLRAEDAHAQLDRLERQAMNEERYGAPANLTRQGTGEQAEYDRKAALFYMELVEAETARGTEHDTQLERDRAWYVAQTEAIDELIAKLQPLYQELRAMDLKMAKLWEIFQRDDQPAQPPVYWSRDRFFLDGEEDAAREAIRVEAAMAKQKAREEEGNALVKAAALVAEMLGL